jgi:hypothetical protein
MPKFRKKPVVIDAEQWFPGKDIPGVRVVYPEVIFSQDGKYYYVDHLTKGNKVDCWMEVERHMGEVPEELKHSSFEGYGEVWPKGGSATYYRKMLPFAFYTLRAGEKKKATLDDNLVKDYAAINHWENINLIPYAWIKTLEGDHKVSPGDWIITGVKGEKYPCKPDIFEQTYERAD